MASTDAGTEAKRRRLTALDGLRGLAACIVVIGHMINASAGRVRGCEVRR
jgi:peptidoglycan/LPS O-acetylase OafA/YrhL